MYSKTYNFRFSIEIHDENWKKNGNENEKLFDSFRNGNHEESSNVYIFKRLHLDR